MNKLNLGCGYDVKEGWLNTNHESHAPVEGAEYLNILEKNPEMNYKFDFVLVNHVFCTMSYEDTLTALLNLREMLAPNGSIQVIDMDLLKCYENYQNKQHEAFPGFEGTIDEKLCKHIVGHGRKSIYTPAYMQDVMFKAGFNSLKELKSSHYDIRPRESFVIEAVR